MTAKVDNVLRVVAEWFSVGVDDIKSLRRTRAILPARHIAAYLAHITSGLTPREVGDGLGGRDDTVILMYCRTVARRALQDEEFGQVIRALEAKIGRNEQRWPTPR